MSLLEEEGQEEAVAWQMGEYMQHSYFLDTVESMRTTGQCFCDMVLLIMTCCFLFAGFATLQDKGLI
jgi:hypothetical protein